MEKNGTLYCENCQLEIKRYDKFVRLPRQTSARQTQPFAHWHNRSSKDCWSKTVEASVTRKKTKPTESDMTAFEKFCAQQDAVRASAQ